MIDLVTLTTTVKRLWAEHAEDYEGLRHADAWTIADDMSTLEIITDCAPGVELETLVATLHDILVNMGVEKELPL